MAARPPGPRSRPLREAGGTLATRRRVSTLRPRQPTVNEHPHPHPQPGTPPTAEEQRRAEAARFEREGTPVGGEPRPDPRARVLVVEDEHELRELIATWRGTRQYQVVQAADGRDAVDLREAGLEPDVILLDLTMPRMDGREFLDWLRASPKHAH